MEDQQNDNILVDALTAGIMDSLGIGTYDDELNVELIEELVHTFLKMVPWKDFVALFYRIQIIKNS